MTRHIIDPVTGKPFGSVPAVAPDALVQVEAPERSVGGADGMVCGVCVYNADQSFLRFVPSLEDGELSETIVIEEGQILVLVQPIAKAVPNPGATIKNIGANQNG